MTNESTEQYRAGFEAWATSDDGGWLPHALARNPEGHEFDYRDDDVQAEWRAWTAAKREASTEPSASSGAGQNGAKTAEARMDAGFEVLVKAGLDSVETLDEKAENALLWCYRRMKNSYGRLPFIEEAVSGLRARRTGALTDDAKDAARHPIVVNSKAPGDLKLGDYVFASRWSDCDPGDPWHVGHVSEIGIGFVVVGDVSQRRWPRATRITAEQGKRITESYPGMEKNYVPLDYEAIARVFGIAAIEEHTKDAAPVEGELIYQSECGDSGGYWQDNSDAKGEFERWGIGYRIVRIVAEVRAPDDDDEAHTKAGSDHGQG